MSDDHEQESSGAPDQDPDHDRDRDLDTDLLELEDVLRPLRYTPKGPGERVALLRSKADDDQERAAMARSRAAIKPYATQSTERDKDRAAGSSRPNEASRFLTAAVIASFALAAGIFAVVSGMREWEKRATTTPIASGTTKPALSTPMIPSSSSTAQQQAVAVTVNRVTGSPSIDTRAITTSAQLGVGEWLETNDEAQAVITLPIGNVNVEPDSRLRLASAASNEQRIELVRGTINARVIAPPRLFIVDTPAARATDLGCAYRLGVDATGAGLLHVSSGAVELAGNGVSSWVPAGAACETRPGRGPGCPYFEDALDTLKVALRRFDASADPERVPPGTVEELLSASRRRDTLTLWHLEQRTHGATRALISARIRALTPGVPKDGGVSLDDLVSHW